MNKKQKKNLYRIIAALVLVLILKLLPQFPTPVELLLYCIPYLVVGWDVLRKALLGIKNRQPFDECFLMAVATVGAFALDGNEVQVGDGGIGPVAQKLYDTLTGIQYGRVHDEFGWSMKVDI